MVPCGPEPTSLLRSRPCSAATRRAAGMARIGAPGGGGAATAALIPGPPALVLSAPAALVAPAAAALGSAATAALGSLATGDAPSSGSTSPGWAISAIGLVTATVEPAGNRMRASTPAAGASTRLVIFSVSTSSTGSPCATVSPSCFSQRLIRPSCMLRPHLGMTSSAGMRR